MKIRLSITLLMLNWSCLTVFGQSSGHVIDAETKDPIPFTSLYLLDYQIGVIADSIGYFEFVDEMIYRTKVKVSASGYESEIFTFLGVNNNLELALTRAHLEIDEVVVSSPRGGMKSENATHVEQRNLEDLNEVPATNMGEMLQQIPGVYSATSGAGVSKPVIRGFQGVRIVTLLNGVRLENQQWGGDHDFGITDLGIGTVEVIKGPSSLLYGADALGGVIYFNDENYASQERYEIKAGTQFESSTMGSKSNLLFKIAHKNVRINAGVNYTNHADYQLPNGQYVENSRFNGYAAKFGLGINKKKWVMHLRYAYSKSYVGIIGAHAEEEDSLAVEEGPEEFQINTQSRGIGIPYQGYENHLVSWENKLFRERMKWQFLVAHSYNQLSEFEESMDEAAMRLTLNNTSYNIRLKYKISRGFELIAGYQGSYQTNVNSGVEEQLIPNAQQIDNGMYAIFYYDRGGKWHSQAGLRYDIRLLNADLVLSDGSKFNKMFGSPNFALGTVYSSDKHTFRANVSSGFRVPHLSELTADGEHHGAARYEIGNNDLKSERAYQLDLAEEIHGEHLELIINPFVSFVQEYIYLKEMDSIIDDLTVFEYQQLNGALLFGGDLAAHYHPHFAHWLHWEPTFSFIYGQDQQGGAIPFIPQTRITNLLRVDFDIKWKFRLENVVLQHSYHFDQYRVSGLETSTKGYNLINLGVNFKYHGQAPIEIGIGVKNVLNERYTDHLSRLKNLGLQNAGRNFYVRLKINFVNLIKPKRNAIHVRNDSFD
ncbi:MAG: TonB-dependent receptor [Crocinitomicaceae bacterium]|nr:TonB-dependent receptor [Crocinitomicaceae bacterium]